MTHVEIQLPKNQKDLSTAEDITNLGNQLILSYPDVFLAGICSVKTADALMGEDLWVLQLAMGGEEQATIGFIHNEILRFIVKQFGWSVFDVVFSTT